MYVEGRVGRDGVRSAVQILMAELDGEAAKNRHRVVGDVTISEEQSPFLGTILRLEADVVPA
jgi:hypothetical protein